MRQSRCRIIIQIDIESRWQISLPGKEIFGHLRGEPLQVMARDIGTSVSKFRLERFHLQGGRYAQDVSNRGNHLPEHSELSADQLSWVL